MSPKRTLLRHLVLFLLAVSVRPQENVRANFPQAPLSQSGAVTAYDLILAMNTLRVSNGLPALIEDPIINAVAQATAETMAASQMSWHIGNVRGRIQAAGYGGGATVWATENFAVGPSMSIDQIMLVWADPDHMRPATNPAYCHVGAGVAKAPNGSTYYILQAAYTSGNACGEYTSPGGGTSDGGDEVPVSQIIIPVKVATPDAKGEIYHEVKSGQSFWSIAIAYQVTIAELEFWNNLSSDQHLRVGQRLFIPSSSTEGYATPTPVGMVVPSQPDADGEIIHEVQPYHTLITIARAYEVKVDTILALNGIQLDWPLQVGQKLLIDPGSVTPSPTPRPLTAIERLTPESDGKYYHTVQSGENLSLIASYYDIRVTDLMAWNGLNASSIIRPDQKLVLQVTPPTTETPTPGPVTSTQTATPSPFTPTASLAPTQGDTTPLATENSASPRDESSAFWLLPLGLVIGGVLLVVLFSRKKLEG
ncbi:MAG: LysM peptidoglycan-binding domain-containing protein [Anaerolineales bacterium]|jgi:LysM repeat protein